MGLVDYSSSSSPPSSDGEGEAKHSPARKKRKTSSANSPSLPLPPLPAAFHDLYASTVRTTTNDDPSLHQGRKRLIPHVAGNWPSHIYVEWHPTAQQHALLTGLLDDLRSASSSLSNDNDGGLGGLLLSPSSSSSETGDLITSFLTSDLGSPLPLHISLSRPIVLRTDEKDAFLEQITDALRGWHPPGSNSKSAFDLGVHDLSWHRSPDSDRSFLVLRVRSSDIVSSSPAATTSTRNGGDNDDNPANRGRLSSSSSPRGKPIIINPELTSLLNRCNNVVAHYGQPRLYSRGRRQQSKNGHNYPHRYSLNSSNDKNAVTTDAALRDANRKNVKSGPNKEDEDEGDIDQTVFHVSIAWSFAKPTAAIQERTAAVFKKTKFQQGILGGEGGGGEGIKIPVESVKVKIGNVVTSTPLASSARTGTRGTMTATRRTGDTGRGLFGV